MRGCDHVRLWVRRPLRRVSVCLSVLVVMLIAVGCSVAGSSGTGVKRAAGSESGCNPSFSPDVQAPKVFYATVIQLLNCSTRDIPLSIDVGATGGIGTPLSSVLPGTSASAIKGSGIVWDAGDGHGAAQAKTEIPHGSGSGTGALTGFSLVPYWDGENPETPGPSSLYVKDKGKSTARLEAGFRGEWALYLPSSTWIFQVLPSEPFPYIPAWWRGASPGNPPGATATYLSVIRMTPGARGQVPLVTQTSKQALRGQSPPFDSYLPNLCYQTESVENGLNSKIDQTSQWSIPVDDGAGTHWNMVVAADDFLGSSDPVLLLPYGYHDTKAGQKQDLQLRDSTNMELSTLSHSIQIGIDEHSDRACGGESNSWDYLGVLGGSLDGIDISHTSMAGAVIANTSMRAARLTNTTLNSPAYAGASLSYTDLGPDKEGNNSDLAGANLSNVNFTGTNLRQADLSQSDLQGAQFLLADLTDADLDDARMSTSLMCATRVNDGPNPFDNTDCNALLRKQGNWEAKSIGGCSPPSCTLVSIYNNTTRTLARGLASCGPEGGKFSSSASLNGPSFIAPLDTGYFRIESTKPEGAKSPAIDCQATYTNGAAGKITIHVDTLDKDRKPTSTVNGQIDAGTCFAARNVDCLPKSVDGVTPIRVDVERNKLSGNQLAFDAILCEASQQKCSSQPSLPGLNEALQSSKASRKGQK